MSKTSILLSSWLRAEFLHQNLNWVCIDKIEDFLNIEKQVKKENSAINKHDSLPSLPLNSLNNISTPACGLDNSNDLVNDQRPVLNTPHSDVMT